jgi:cell division protein FtsI/penicillin-binding protein 2
MAKQQQYKRLLLLALLLGAAFAGLGYRLVDLQVIRHDELLAKAQQNTKRASTIEPRRGDILDAKGNLLATSVFVKTVCADPVLVGNRQADVARALAPLLQMSDGELYQRLLPRLRQNNKGEAVTNRYVVLKRKVAVETWEKIQAKMGSLTFGVDEKKLTRPQQAFFRDLRQGAMFADPIDDQLRVYPNGPLAAHVLGFVGVQDRDTNGTHVVETVGMEGIERTMNSKLTGARGWLVTETDRQRRELVSLREQDIEPRDGLNVVLTVDSVIQHALEAVMAEAAEKHSPISISGIVVRPRTGEIVAMATLPDFDPNNPGAAQSESRRNRAITDVMEPGSTFKIVTVSGALNERVVSLTDVFYCENGAFPFAGRVLHDSEGHHYGNLTVEDIIMHSSNIGAAKIGIKLGEDKLHDYIRDYGFGERTGIALPGESPGIVYPVKDWSKVSIAQIPMGQGIAVTRLQMMMAMCAIANGGWLMRPAIVDRLEDRDGHVIAKSSPQRVRQVISESAAKQMVEALKTVVTDEGTAPKAALEHYEVAGKTGTAQKAMGGVYVPGKHVATFIGFFPADNPELCISIVLDEPKDGYYGGQVAAPVFKEIAGQAANYLNIRPDLNDEPQTNNQAVAAATGSLGGIKSGGAQLKD